MKIIDLFKKLRGKITGLNILLLRLDWLQNSLDSFASKINKLNDNLQELPLATNQLNSKLIESQAENTQLSQEKFDTLQLQMGNIESIVEQLKQILKIRPSFEKQVLGFPNDSHEISTANFDAIIDSQNDLNSVKVPNYRKIPVVKILPGEKIRLVFLVITPEIWPSLESVWKLAKNDDRFSVSIVVLKSTNTEIALTSLTKALIAFDTAGISYFTERNFSLESYRPHVVFYPLPYGSLYPQSYKPELVSAMGYRIAYVSYGLEVGGGAFNSRYQYDSDVPRVAWRIFARSLGQLTNFGRYCRSGNGHVVVTGHPRLERYQNPEIPYLHPAKLKANGRLVVLWTPHFSVLTRRKWSSFLDHYETILKLISDRPNLFLLVRPHPFLKISLAKIEGWSTERVDEWFNIINKRDDALVDFETNYFPAFEVSTALMADAGSFLVEYLHTAKPICHLTGKDDIGLSEEVNKLSCFYPGSNEIEIADFLDRVTNGVDDLTEARKSAIMSYFGAAHQSPSETILNVIAKEIVNPNGNNCVAEDLTPSYQKQAFRYWIKNTDSFIAPDTSLQDLEIKLKDILNRYATGRLAADIGCGSGQLTRVLSQKFEYVEGVDSNEALINEAREYSLQKGIKNICYSVERLEHAESLSTYDFVSCMDLTSDLIDDELFIKFIWKLKAAMRPGAKLLMKDYLHLTSQEFVEWSDNKAVYRNLRAYLDAFETIGLSLIEEVDIAHDTVNCRINSFFLFKEKTN